MTQKLWRVLGDVLHRLPAKMLPFINPPRLLADRFVEFFTGKIEKICSTFPTSLKSQHITADSPPQCFPLSLDPWPTFLDYLDILITPITSIINASLEQVSVLISSSRPMLPLSSKIILRQRNLQKL